MYRITYVHKNETEEHPLYVPGDQDYCLTDAKLQLECGKSGELDVSIPDVNPAKQGIVCLTDEVIFYRDDEELWRGRPVTVQLDFDNTGELICEGILSYLYDTYYEPFEFEGSPKDLFRQILENHNKYVDERKQFQVGEITVEDPNDYINRSSIYYDRTLNVLTEKLINDSLGGYFRARVAEDGTRYLDYLENYNGQTSQVVEYGSNILDIAQEIEYSDLATVILPLGARLEDEEGVQTDEYTTIASVNGGSIYYEDPAAVEEYGWICVSNEWDDVTLPENLLDRAKTYLEQVTSAVASFTINAVDLSIVSKDEEPISLGDFVHIQSVPHNIDQYVELTEMTIYPLAPENDVLVFGADTSGITDNQRNSDRNLQTALGSLSMRLTNLTTTVLSAVYASIETIIAETITTEYIEAKIADLGYVTADYLEAYYMTAAMIEANYLTAGSAIITDLTAFEATITAMFAGQAGVGELQTIHLTTDNAVIDDAVIMDALINNAIIGTLLAGNIYTDYIKISNNEDNNLLIDGATIQISDGTIVRMQMGLDASGNYNIYILNADGDVIFDALGLTEAGLIGNGAIIRDIAVADDANISGYKLNIEEVGMYLNETGYTLEAAQVTIDGETLDYRLTQMTEQIEGISFEGLVTFETYFCLWSSAIDPPPDEEDFVPALTDIAETDKSYTDLYDYSDLWTKDEPANTDGLYKWVKYLLYYEDGHTEWSDPYCITDDFIREQTTVMQTELSTVQGQISAKIWMSDITEALNTTVSDFWTEINMYLGEIETQVGQMSTTMDSLSAQVATQDITISNITSEVYDIQLQIAGLDMNGMTDIVTYFCLWSSAIDPPPDEADFTPALTDIAETDRSYTDLYDYADLWSTDEPDPVSGLYKWVRYLAYYQDEHTAWSTPYCVSDEYARMQVEGAYSQIEQLANSITLSVSGALGNKAQIKLTVNGDEIAQDLDLSAVRQAFADDESEVMISAGLINFASNTIIINSDNLTVTQDGSIYATNAYLEGEVVTTYDRYRTRIVAGQNQYWVQDYDTTQWKNLGEYTSAYLVGYPQDEGIGLFAEHDAQFIGFAWDDDASGDKYTWLYIMDLSIPEGHGFSGYKHNFYGTVYMDSTLTTYGNIYAGTNIWFDNNRGLISYKTDGSDYAWMMWLNTSNNLCVGSVSDVNETYLNAKNNIWIEPENGYAYVVYPENTNMGWPIYRVELWWTTIYPSAANTPTGVAFTWSQKYASAPWCFCNAESSVPGTQVTGASMAGISTTGATGYLTRTNTTGTSFDVMVIGL